MILILNILLKFTWNRMIGERLKYKLKKLNFDYKKVSWSIMVYATSENVLKKNWKKQIFLSWFSVKKVVSTKNISGFADPFLITHSDKLYLFCETIVNQKGEIWCAQVIDNKLIAIQEALIEPFHLSFPNVFEFEGDFYMIPESCADGTVRLYKSAKFPSQWELHKILYQGSRFVDTNFLNVEGVFYWFTFDLDSNLSRLFYSHSLLFDWIEHDQSPFPSNRNAGNFIFEEGLMLRPVQVSKNHYGEAVKLMKIVTLNQQKFEEEDYIVPFLSSQKGFNTNGTHHISTVKFKNKSFVAVDGKNNNFYSIV